MTETILEKSIYLKADKQTVWSYLTDPEKLAIWFHKPKQPLAEGEPFEMFGVKSGDKVIWGTVLTARPYDRLNYTFTVTPMGDAVSTVSWTLTDVPGGTHLALKHTGIPQGAEAFDLTLAFDKGWDEHLGRMRADLHPEVVHS